VSPEPSAIVAPEVRDLDELARQLAKWLADRMAGASALRVEDLSYPRGAGMSHETILFDAVWLEDGAERRRGMVVRIKPTRVRVFLDDMFEEQFRLMRVMHESGLVRVAEPLWFEASPALLGAPFFVMEKKIGRVAVSYPPYSCSGWLAEEATPGERRVMWEDAVTQLALVQRVPVTAAPFLRRHGVAPGLAQETDRWARFVEWVDPEGEQRVLRDAYAALLDRAPANRPEGIVWGDGRLGNMMIAPDYTVAAVMDWEQPSLGGALHDLGWWLFSDHNQTAAQGIQPLAGMGTRDETIALWSEVSGKSAADIDWYETFACFKMDCLSISTARSRTMPVNVGARVPGARSAARIAALAG
jgi:aminoglycoside phosphotransferase (APT) family kinase protein